MFGDQVTLGQAVLIALFSITVVFLVLLAISYLIEITAKIVNRQKKEAPSVPAPEVSETAQTVQNDGELTAAITAAVAAYLGREPGTFVVRSITKADSESDWSRLSRSGALR